jgi:hypothetical protein
MLGSVFSVFVYMMMIVDGVGKIHPIGLRDQISDAAYQSGCNAIYHPAVDKTTLVRALGHVPCEA